MSEEEYIRERLDEQTQWFSRKSAENQKKYKRYRKAQSICILLVPVLSLFPCFSVRIAAALCGLLAAYLQFACQLDQYHELWRCYRLACERLKHEKLLCQTGTGAYADKSMRFQLLVEATESIIAATNTDWNIITESEPQSPAGS